MPSPDPSLGVTYVCYCTGERISVPVAGPPPKSKTEILADKLELIRDLMSEPADWRSQESAATFDKRSETHRLAGECIAIIDTIPDVPVRILCPSCGEPMQVEA